MKHKTRTKCNARLNKPYRPEWRRTEAFRLLMSLFNFIEESGENNMRMNKENGKCVGNKAVAVIAATAAGASVLLALAGCSGNGGDENTDADGNASTTTEQASNENANASANTGDADLMEGIHHVSLKVEGYDPIEIELNADAAPITVTNFMQLAEDGYYDGLTFYRIADGFCLQGGTLGNTASGSDPTLTEIDGEFSGNGYENPLADDFTKGTVAMARTTDPNSATSTFFITLGDDESVAASLNGQYAAFGTIGEDGMKIVDQIVADHIGDVAEGDTMGMIDDESKQPVIEGIDVID